jgi:hypothetical protein
VDADERRGRRTTIGHLLHDQRRLQPPEIDPAALLRHVDRGKAEFRRRTDRVAREDVVLVPLRGMRRDAIGSEPPRQILDLALVVGKVELVGHIRNFPSC